VEIEDMVSQFVSEVARRGMDHLVARSAPSRYCAHCRNDLNGFTLTLQCCGRVLCGPCAGNACIHKWKKRCVIVCDDCQDAHTFEVAERNGTLALFPLSN
jgi:hypothetical protein